jgi:protein SCO1
MRPRQQSPGYPGHGQDRRRGIVALGAVAVVAAAGLLAWARPAAGPSTVAPSAAAAPPLEAGTPFPEPRALPEFRLLDQEARPFTRASLAGQWSLVFAGFTHCPDVCPTTLVTLAAIEKQLHGAGRDLRVVFLSLDPERDAPAALGPYLDFYSPRFTGATGPAAEIDKLMAGLGLSYIKVPQEAGRYTIDHSAALILVDPAARAVAYFKPPLRADRIAADLRPLVREP